MRGGTNEGVTVSDSVEDGHVTISKVSGFHEERNQRMTLDHWDPDDTAFWQTEGWKIAYYNLFVSTVALFLGFAIWTQWGGMAKQVIAAHKADKAVYSFGYASDKAATKDHNAAVKLLAPIAGISGATSRVVHAWAVNPCGGRNTNLGSCICIMIAMFTGAFTLLNDNCSIWLLYFAAILSGIGGGIFSSSVSNVSFFAPDRLQGSFLGIDGGFGNLGVAVQAQLVPRVAKIGMCMAGGDAAKGTFEGACNSYPLGKKFAWNPLFF